MDASGAGPASRSQLPGWVRGGLTGLAAAKGILYRDINTPIPVSNLRPRVRLPATPLAGEQRKGSEERGKDEERTTRGEPFAPEAAPQGDSRATPLRG